MNGCFAIEGHVLALLHHGRPVVTTVALHHVRSDYDFSLVHEAWLENSALRRFSLVIPDFVNMVV